MSSLISRGDAVRAAVLLSVGALAFSLAQLVPTDSALQAPVAPEQALARALSGDAAPVPISTPLPVQVPVATEAALPVVGTARTHRALAKHRHRRAGRTARRAPNPWRSQGGRDISWPQCPRNVGFRGQKGFAQPMPDQGVSFVIVGLTSGRAFTPNPCLDMHLRWIRDHHVNASAYAFAAYPTRAQLRRHRFRGPYDGRHRLGALANTGVAAARYNVATMQQHGFASPHVWLDVEPSSTNPWSGHPRWNRAVVRGWIRGYRDAGYTVGVYSTASLWRDIVGRLRLGLPEWRTGGPASAAAALRTCRGSSIQGGPAVVAQWWTQHRDFDRLCPGPSRSTTLERYFHQW